MRTSPSSYFEVLQQFEGTVLEFHDSTFKARLIDKTGSAPAELADFDRDELSPSDEHLLTPGAVFYWIIGYNNLPWGQRERASKLVFRRMPVWSGSDIARAKEQASSWAALLDDGSE